MRAAAGLAASRAHWSFSRKSEATEGQFEISAEQSALLDFRG
jgi:hypothetical protein